MSNTIYSDKIKVNCQLVHDENGYYHLVYKIVNTVNGKIYIGKHSTKNPYDDYMGSGLKIGQAIKKYGIENFTKEILYCFTDEKEAFLKEEEIVDFEFVKNENTYNIAVGGNMIAGSWSGEKNPMYGKPSAMRGKHHTQEAKDKILGNFILSQETNMEKASTLGWFELSGRGFGYINEFPQLVKSVTATDIIRVANKYFEQPYVYSVVAPQNCLKKIK